MSFKQTWDLDTLTRAQKDLLIEVCNTNDGVISYETDEITPETKTAAVELKRLGLLLADFGSEDILVTLTTAGETWLRSLPEGALSSKLDKLKLKDEG